MGGARDRDGDRPFVSVEAQPSPPPRRRPNARAIASAGSRRSPASLSPPDWESGSSTAPTRSSPCRRASRPAARDPVLDASMQNDPWQSAVEKYQIGERVSGKVTNITNFGAFVELEPGLEGLIHVTEMSWTKRVRHPQEMVKVGDSVEAVVLRIDNKDRRISLGLRQTTEDPWSTLPDRLPPGTPVKGKITGITDFGVFMEIEEGIEGLIHISELSHDRVTNPAELFKRGDEIDAVILNIDPVEQRASLSRKRTIPYDGPARDYTKQGGGERGDRAMGTGSASRPQGGGQRRKREGFDYDYSYAKESTTSASSGKISTKLGDVYADLFAQFGIGAKKKKAKSNPLCLRGRASCPPFF